MTEIQPYTSNLYNIKFIHIITNLMLLQLNSFSLENEGIEGNNFVVVD